MSKNQALMNQDLSIYTKNIPGPDANLPGFIYDRMLSLGFKPTLTKLSELTGIASISLQRNLKGERAIRLSTAKKIADAIEVTIDELINKVPTLLGA